MKRSIAVVGLTGQTGAGKSTVSQILRSQELVVIDCDKVARDVTVTQPQCLCDLALEFSTAILNVDGSLNRKKLGSMVFGYPQKLKRLNTLIFPYILREIDRQLDELAARGERLAVLDAPTLFESGANETCDFIASVIAPESIRQSRIMIRDHLTDDEARNRINSQHGDRFFREHSDAVIVNDGAPDQLHVHTLELIETLRQKFLSGEEPA